MMMGVERRENGAERKRKKKKRKKKGRRKKREEGGEKMKKGCHTHRRSLSSPLSLWCEGNEGRRVEKNGGKKKEPEARERKRKT